jgi:3-hydroxyisobutyrate dehydrogenase-like beta-hydroxyacid dehydrogenase
MTKVGFIGLGRMGHGMAGRYLDAGFSVKDTIMLAILDANLAGVGLHTSIVR